MKKLIYIIFIILFNCESFSQNVVGKWQIVDYSNADTETYSEVLWEFTSGNRCIWKLKEDNSIIFEFTYSISNRTCDDNIIDGDSHLTLINIEDGEKLCYVFYGVTNSGGRITMSINEYAKQEPILFVKK